MNHEKEPLGSLWVEPKATDHPRGKQSPSPNPQTPKPDPESPPKPLKLPNPYLDPQKYVE